MLKNMLKCMSVCMSVDKRCCVVRRCAGCAVRKKDQV